MNTFLITHGYKFKCLLIKKLNYGLLKFNRHKVAQNQAESITSITFKPGVLNRASETVCKPSGSEIVSKVSNTDVLSAAAFFLSSQKLASTLDFLFFSSSQAISADITRLGKVKSTPLNKFLQLKHRKTRIVKNEISFLIQNMCFHLNNFINLNSVNKDNAFLYVLFLCLVCYYNYL